MIKYMWNGSQQMAKIVTTIIIILTTCACWEVKDETRVCGAECVPQPYHAIQSQSTITCGNKICQSACTLRCYWKPHHFQHYNVNYNKYICLIYIVVNVGKMYDILTRRLLWMLSSWRCVHSPMLCEPHSSKPTRVYVYSIEPIGRKYVSTINIML